jgi:hypothetical protein
VFCEFARKIRYHQCVHKCNSGSRPFVGAVLLQLRQVRRSHSIYRNVNIKQIVVLCLNVERDHESIDALRIKILRHFLFVEEGCFGGCCTQRNFSFHLATCWFYEVKKTIPLFLSCSIIMASVLASNQHPFPSLGGQRIDKNILFNIFLKMWDGKVLTLLFLGSVLLDTIYLCTQAFPHCVSFPFLFQLFSDLVLHRRSL